MTFHLKKLNSADSLPYFIREMAALTMLKKAGVQHVVDLRAVRSDGSLELELYDGDLFDVQDTALATEDQLVYTIYRILVTLCRIQHLNLSHRDIKPENILASKDGKRLALCDFGLTRYYSNGHYPDQTTPSVQTACYRAPEIMFRDNALYDHGIIGIGNGNGNDIDIDIDIGKVNPNNMDIWSLGITALRLLDLDEFLPAEEGMSPVELYGLYEQTYGQDGLFASYIDNNKEENGPFLTQFLWLICDMLTINSDLRADAKTLLCHPIFDCYSSYEAYTTDFTQFEQARVSDLLKVLPEAESDKLVRQHLNSIAHYQFNNVESARLASCILYLLPKEDRASVDIMTVIALAASIFDTDTIDMSVSNITEMLAKLNYDIMLPVMHRDIGQRLTRLFRTV